MILLLGLAWSLLTVIRDAVVGRGALAAGALLAAVGGAVQVTLIRSVRAECPADAALYAAGCGLGTAAAISIARRRKGPDQ